MNLERYNDSIQSSSLVRGQELHSFYNGADSYPCLDPSHKSFVISSKTTLLSVELQLTTPSGRQIALQFINLPNKRTLPEYYEVTKLPISIATIEAKLRRHEFPNLAALEGYFRRMVQNAKDFNEKGSEIHEDAERLRKASSNWMTKNNPAYKTSGYTPRMTPLPGDDDPAEANAEEEEFEAVEPVSTKRKGRPGRPTKRKSATPSAPGGLYAPQSFSGLTFQQAQEKIVDDMIQYKEDPEFVDSAHF
jgi:hypothetical protein